MTTANVFDRQQLPLDPPLELIERIRRDAEAAELALHRGALDRDQFGRTCGLLVFAAITVMREQCDQDDTTPARVLAEHFAHDPALLERRLAVARRKLAQLHFALLLARAQTVLDSPDSVCMHHWSIDFSEMPELLLDGRWHTVVGADYGSGTDSTPCLITADGRRMPFPWHLLSRVWVRGRRTRPLLPERPQRPVPTQTGAQR